MFKHIHGWLTGRSIGSSSILGLPWGACVLGRLGCYQRVNQERLFVIMCQEAGFSVFVTLLKKSAQKWIQPGSSNEEAQKMERRTNMTTGKG